MAELLFRQGTLPQLFQANGAINDFKEGSLNFTIDEPAIYFDVKKDGKDQRLRIGDIREFDSIGEIKKYLQNAQGQIPSSGLYYAKEENVLMKFDSANKSWKQINLTDDQRKTITDNISALQAAVTAAQSKADSAHTLADSANTNANGRVLQSEFDAFKESNTSVIDAVRTLAQEGVDNAAAAQSTANGAVTAAAQANTNANNRVLQSDFETFKTNNSTAIKAADDKAVAAQTQANKGVTDAAAAQKTADGAVTAATQAKAAADAADAKAETRLPKTDFNEFKKTAIVSDGSVAMAANLDLSTKKIVNLGDPAADADAANKKYVDNAINALGGIQNGNIGTLRGQVVLRDGTATLTDNWNINTSSNTYKITGLPTPTADSDAVNKSYVDDKFKTADAMQFKGVVNSATDLLASAANIEAGWTYKVGTAFSIGSGENKINVYVGDLLIANTDASATVVYSKVEIGTTGATWSHVSSGYETKNASYLSYEVEEDPETKIVTSRTLYLDDIQDGRRGSIAFMDEEDTNVKVNISSVTGVQSPINGVTSHINVGFKLEWGTFN